MTSFPVAFIAQTLEKEKAARAERERALHLSAPDNADYERYMESLEAPKADE